MKDKNGKDVYKHSDIKKIRTEQLKKARSVLARKRRKGQATHSNPNGRDPLKMQQDEIEVMKLVNQGYSIREIAAKLNLSYRQVERNRDKCFEEMAKSYAGDVDSVRSRMLGQLHYCFIESNDAWQKSKENKETIETSTRVADAANSKHNNPLPKPGAPIPRTLGKKETKTSSVKVEGRDGDPRFLAVMVKCLELEKELLNVGAGAGGDKPEDAFKTQEDTRSLLMNRLASLGAKLPNPPAGTDAPEIIKSEPIDIKATTIN